MVSAGAPAPAACPHSAIEGGGGGADSQDA